MIMVGWNKWDPPQEWSYWKQANDLGVIPFQPHFPTCTSCTHVHDSDIIWFQRIKKPIFQLHHGANLSGPAISPWCFSEPWWFPAMFATIDSRPTGGAVYSLHQFAMENPPFLLGKVTISYYFDWAIFNSYVKLPEGRFSPSLQFKYTHWLLQYL